MPVEAVEPPSERTEGRPESADVERPELHDDFYGQPISSPSFLVGAAAGLVTAVLGAAVWAIATVVSGYQIGWMAIGVGALVGLSVRKAAPSHDRRLGMVGAACALFGCLLGNLAACYEFVAREFHSGYLETVQGLGVSGSLEVLKSTSSPIDLIFYALAIGQGYKLAFHRDGD